MEKRNLTLDARLTPEQWDMLARTAQELAPVEGFDWSPRACNEIEVYMRAEDAPGAWRDWIAAGSEYGAIQSALRHSSGTMAIHSRATNSTCCPSHPMCCHRMSNRCRPTSNTGCTTPGRHCAAPPVSPTSIPVTSNRSEPDR